MPIAGKPTVAPKQPKAPKHASWKEDGVFDSIANEWEEYRSHPNTALKFFLPQVAGDDAVLEAGCANGRNLPPLAAKARIVIAFDISPALVKFALARIAGLDNATAFKGSVTAIPLPESHFDKIFCLAVLHHLSTPESRAQAMAELYRVLKPGGLLFVTVWNRHQKKFENLTQADAIVNWKNKSGETVKRFYHFFEEDEFRGLAEKAGFEVNEVFYDKHRGKAHHDITMHVKGAQNICVVLEKPYPGPVKPKNLFPSAKATKRKK